MDFDLEIIDEEGDCPDPLFDSIMNAMNSMKEATADKIYQKIKKEGETNYSKPQVDRALASALKYGIFEVRNNRYRVRDDILDDEDTVYWKFQKEREQTPFRIQEDINEKQFGPKLDPEKDNRRFRKINSKESQECPHCGKTKKPMLEEKRLKTGKKAIASKKKRKSLKKEVKNYNVSKKKIELKRKRRSDFQSKERFTKRKKPNEAKQSEPHDLCDNDKKSTDASKKERNTSQENKANVSVSSEINTLPASENSFDSYLDEDNPKHYKGDRDFGSPNLYDCEETELNIVNAKRSSTSIKSDNLKSESDSEETDISTDSDDHSQNKVMDSFFDNLPCTSKNVSSKMKNQYLSSSELYNNQYKSSQTDKCQEKSDWLGCSDEPQGAIIQTKNVLTIEPMDSLAFKSPEQASYIS